MRKGILNFYQKSLSSTDENSIDIGDTQSIYILENQAHIFLEMFFIIEIFAPFEIRKHDICLLIYYI